VPALKPGLAFRLACDNGFAVGLMTHHVDRFGHLIWIAEPMFDDAPTLEEAQSIRRWRWPVFFPLGAAIRRKVVTPIGVIPIPPDLVRFPVLRGSLGAAGKWRTLTFIDGKEKLLGWAEDATIPINKLVNDTALKEMLISGWAPEKEWLDRSYGYKPSAPGGGAELQLGAVVGGAAGQFRAVPGDDLPDPPRGERPEQVVAGDEQLPRLVPRAAVPRAGRGRGRGRRATRPSPGSWRSARPAAAPARPPRRPAAARRTPRRTRTASAARPGPRPGPEPEPPRPLRSCYRSVHLYRPSGHGDARALRICRW